MTNQLKIEIAEKLQSYVAQFPSQNRAAGSLKDVSTATVSQVLNEKWDKISDEMWRSIDAQIAVGSGWRAAETRFFKLFTELLQDSKKNANVYAIIAEAGSGKSFAARHYSATTPNVYHIVCNEWWGLRAFLSEVLRAMGLGAKASHNDNPMMFATIVSALRGQDHPLVILDEADKLSDRVLYSFISLYNQLEEVCGITLCATASLEQRIMKGVHRNRKGYNEIYSRIGRRFVSIPEINAKDIALICQLNGISDELDVTEITNDSDGDLRRVRRKIHAKKIA